MNLQINNWTKPSNKKWKLIGDICIYSLPLFLTAVMAAPISEDWKLWINFLLSVILVGAKTISKFTAE